MFHILKGFESISAHAESNSSNPYAVDVIRAKRRDLIYGISHTELLLNLLVTEGAMTAAKKSIILKMRTCKDQNSRVLDLIVERGERACRKFFHPCLMMAEPDLYQRIKTYVGAVNESFGDTRRQLIGYLLERDKAGMGTTSYPTVTEKNHHLFSTKGSKKSSILLGDTNTGPLLKPEEHKPAKREPEYIFNLIASGGSLSQLQELLDDTDINAVNSRNETLLHVAAEHGDLSIIEFLLDRGARLDLQDSKGQTALHRAASRGHTEAVRALLKAGAPIYTMDEQGKTPVHLAAEDEHLDTVKALVEEETRSSKSQTQDTFLHMVAREDSWRLAELLLQSGATAEATNNQKQTALFYAVTGNNEKTVSVLLKAGAKVDLELINEAIKLNHGSILHLLLAHAGGTLSAEALSSALLSAVRQNHEGTVTALIDSGANVNVCDKQGYIPLLLSAELGHTEVFRVLVEKQARLDATLPNLSSALHLAIHGGSAPIVQMLLEKGLDPSIVGPKSQTPLHLATQCNRPAFVRLLIRSGAQVNAAAQDGFTPLHIASQQGHAETALLLIQGKADPGARDRQGRTPLHWAASAPGQSSVVDVLLSARADPNITDKEKKTALHLAAMEGRAQAVTSLLAHKAKGGVKDMDGSTALHYAAAGGHVDVVTTLLRSLKNKGIEERNTWRKTPLHTAAERGHHDVAELLLEAGAKINSTDNSKDTPLHCAARGGHVELVRKLVRWGQAGHMGQGKKVNLQATNNLGKTPLQVAEGGETEEHENITTLLKKKMLLIK
ncbi:CARD- and ANK-domain containing inflammasome adapter protein [Genypterus blacodes]|uniref:CARD- and ANK-domain containing inflammasome adapter protein n=1 Tax=Genypterus blacodes TaxID=154954 RepID=UPI003F75EDC1